jgi:RNA polymerase sigma-70 factor (ECF subfamily)
MTSKRERDRAVKELLDRHYVAVWRTLLRLGLDDDRAHDAALEVFMVGSNKLERIQPGCERRFLLRTAVMIAANFRRMSWVRHEVSNEHAVEQHLDPDPQADQLIYNRHLRQKLAEILDSLPDELRAVFVLFELEGLSAPEIAEITGAKAGTVASRLRRARQLFQRSVQRLKARGLIEGGSP